MTENSTGKVVHDGESPVDVAAEVPVDLRGDNQASVSGHVGVLENDVAGVIRGKFGKC